MGLEKLNSVFDNIISVETTDVTSMETTKHEIDGGKLGSKFYPQQVTNFEGYPPGYNPNQGSLHTGFGSYGMEIRQMSENFGTIGSPVDFLFAPILGFTLAFNKLDQSPIHKYVSENTHTFGTFGDGALDPQNSQYGVQIGDTSSPLVNFTTDNSPPDLINSPILNNYFVGGFPNSLNFQSFPFADDIISPPGKNDLLVHDSPRFPRKASI